MSRPDSVIMKLGTLFAVVLFILGLGFLAIFGAAIFTVGKVVTAKRSGYHITSNRVQWGVYPAHDADPATFEGFDQKNGKPFPWGRDAKHGYYRDLCVRNSHGPSFQPVDEKLAKDRNHVYKGGRLVKGGGDPSVPRFTTQKGKSVSVFKGADARTFRKNGECYVDKNHVFLPWLAILKHADPATFRQLPVGHKRGYHYWADANHVFYGRDVVEHADPKTFRRDKVTDELVMDDQFLYLKGKRIESSIDGKVVPARSSSWRYFRGTKYLTDGRVLFRPFSPYIPIPDADPATWEVFGPEKGNRQCRSVSALNHMYAKDANHVWYGHGKLKLIPGADPKSFVYVGDGYGKDAKHVWLSGNPLANVDPASFESLSHFYVRDAKHVWHRTEILPDADPASFLVLDNLYARDKKNVWYDGHWIPNANPRTLRLLKNHYAKDTSHVWWAGQEIPNVDVPSFQVHADLTISDKTGPLPHPKRRRRKQASQSKRKAKRKGTVAG